MDEEDEDYVLFGTPLPEMEDEAVLRKKAAKEQQVRDEKGRQRFHGAFTGGFSAGYFNTVGTKEGWAPSTFISSRGKTADRLQQNPEDFMDDEDFGVFGIATRKIHTTSNFQDSSFKNEHKRKYIDSDSVIPGEAPLKDIVQPVRESIGVLILKKLGWRQGQGIGPRIKKYTSGTKVYGCSAFPDAVIPEEDDPMAVAFTFAPDDAEEISYKPKDDYFGLGYTGLSKQSVLSVTSDPFAPTTTKSWLAKDKRKLKITGQAFGVGAFEDDDEDIYGKDDLSQYDFSDLAVKGPGGDSKAIELPQQGNAHGILIGFQLASQPPVVKKHYAPPSLPPNFKPIHLKSASRASQNVNLAATRHALSASDRSILLGERKLQKVSLNVPVAVEEKQKPTIEHISNLPSTSSASLNFRPFRNDLAKQKRYDEYLRLKEKGDLRNLVQPSSMTEWEKQQEFEEFAKASVLFKPLSNVLSSRFESRSQLSVEHEVMSAIEKIRREKTEKPVVVKKNLVGSSNRNTFEWHPVSLLCKRMNVPNPYPNSDTSETRSILKSKSVFDHLNFSSESVENSGKKDSTALPIHNNLENKMEMLSENISEKLATDIPVSVKNNEDLPSEGKRPPMDFFKDIFGNSSSEEEAEDEKNEASHDKTEVNREKNEVDVTSSRKDLENLEKITDNFMTVEKTPNKNAENESNQKIDNTRNRSTNTKVGFGVFANLDLDALNQRKPTERSVLPVLPDVLKSTNEATSDSNPVSSLKDSTRVEKQAESEDMYGPELPPDFPAINAMVATHDPHNVSSKKHSKSKSSRKHKHHKHKHKKKKKKSSKRASSSSESSEDELDDIPPSVIIEKIKKLQRRKP